MDEYTVTASRVGAHAGEARGRSVVIPLDTALDGRADALGPVELLLAAVAAGVLGGVERAAAALPFRIDAASVRVHAGRDGAGGRAAVEYDLLVDTPEPDHRLAQFHERVRRAITATELGAQLAPISGRIRRSPERVLPIASSRRA